jgi:hypothetical protein
MTAEIEIITLSPSDARALTDQIKADVETVWDRIERAYLERAWAALGYANWDEYCLTEFGTSRLRLPREERPEIVASLREAGLSIRAIASATGAAYRSAWLIISVLNGIRDTQPTLFDYRPKIPVETRQEVFDRDGNSCQNCGSTEDLTLDHIQHWSRGGTDAAENLRVYCRTCNSKRGDQHD